MKILVTGCAGFIGSHLCEKLLQNKKIRIYGIDNLNSYYSPQQKKNNLSILSAYSNFSFYEEGYYNN